MSPKVAAYLMSGCLIAMCLCFGLSILVPISGPTSAELAYYFGGIATGIVVGLGTHFYKGDSNEERNH